MAKSSGRRFSDPAEAFRHRTEWQGDCLIWTGSLTKGGYGKLYVAGKLRGAHQFAWEQANGSIPDGMEVGNACHNRACCNVAHLHLATSGQNHQNLRNTNPNNRSSGVRGVYWNASVQKWGAKATHQGRQYYAGTHPTIREAELAAIALRNRLFTHNLMDRQAA